jgi:O-antigen/teichoic acid export membrane protein
MVVFFSRYIARIMNIAPIQRQSLISLLSTLAFTIIGFFSTMYFAHTIGPAPLGEYYVFLAYFGIFNLIGDGGFGGAVVKRISEGKDQNEYLSAFIFLRVVLLVGSVFALLLMVYFFSMISAGVSVWLLAALVIAVFSSSTAMDVYGTGKVGIYQISAFCDAFFRIIIQVIAVYLGFSAGGLAGGFVAGLIVGGLVNLRYVSLRIARFRISHIKNLMGFSMWIFLASSGSLVFSYADTLLISYFLGNAETGIYRTAFQLTSVAMFTTLALHTVLYPRISNWEAQKNMAAIENALSRAFTYSLFLAIPVCLGGWVLGESLLYYLYGSSFVSGADALYLLLLVQVANVFMYLGTMSLNSLNRPRDAFLATAVASLLNIILDLILIPVFGISGAAAATLIAMILNAAIAFVLLSRIIRVRLEYKPVRNILIAALLMDAVIILIRFFISLTSAAFLLGTVVLGAGLYLLILLKIDRGIHDEIFQISTGLGLPWPRWLREGF